MESGNIEAIALEIAELEQFRLLKRPINFGLIP